MGRKIHVLANENSNHVENLKVIIFVNRSKASFPKGLFASNYFYIILVGSGSISIRINDIERQLNENELIVIPRKSFCKVLTVSKNSQIYIVHFTSEFAFKNSVRKLHIGYFGFFITRFPQKISLKSKAMVFIIDLVRFLDYRQNDSEHQFQKEIVLFSFNLLLYEIAGAYFNNDRRGNKIRHTKKEKFILRFLKLLEEHCPEEHQVTFYADALFVTTGYLSRTVKDVIGKTTKQCIDETLVVDAKILLREDRLSISEIADALYFSDITVFGKFFKKHTGMTPTDYRSNLKL